MGAKSLLKKWWQIISGTIDVECPSCGKELVQKRSSFSLCPNCECLIFTSEKSSKLIELHCPYCQQRFAANPSYGDLRCINCGAARKIEDGQVKIEVAGKVCSTCNARLPDRVFGCRECNTLVMPLDPLLKDYSSKMMLARDSFGLNLHMRGRLVGLRERLAQIDTALDQQNRDTSYYASQVDSLTTIMSTLLTPEFKDKKGNLNPTDITPLVKEIDRLYAKCLLRTHDAAVSPPVNIMLRLQTLKRSYPLAEMLRFLEWFDNAGQAGVRSELHKALEQIASQQGARLTDFGCPNWRTHLIWQKYDKDSHFRLTVVQDPGGLPRNEYLLENPSPLKVEALRIWPGIEKESWLTSSSK